MLEQRRFGGCGGALAVLVLGISACAPPSVSRFPGKVPAMARRGAGCVKALALAALPSPDHDEPFKTTASTDELWFHSRRGVLSFLLSSDFSEYREEYVKLWKALTLDERKTADLERHLGRMKLGKPIYDKVESQTGVPWWWIAVTHGLEAGYDFSKHLHNGDPLSARTVHVPRGRPAEGSPPFAWETSAADALGQDKITGTEPWSDIAYVAYAFERYNGFGYRKQGIHSPYLWSYSNHYSKGKYVADGDFDPEAVSGQAGSMVILRFAVEKGVVNLAAAVGAGPEAGSRGDDATSTDNTGCP